MMQKSNKNLILMGSIFFALFTAIVSAGKGWAVPMIVALAYLLFMLVNNWEWVVGKRDEIDEILDAEADCRMIHLFKREDA